MVRLLLNRAVAVGHKVKLWLGMATVAEMQSANLAGAVVVIEVGREKERFRMPTVIGIAGGSASGKTTLSKAIQKELGEHLCEIIYQDSYYYDQNVLLGHSDLAEPTIAGDQSEINFDHPTSIDFKLLEEHLQQLKARIPVEVPSYCFKTHSRLPETRLVEPKLLTIVDGILILSQEKIRQQLDLMVFINTAEEIRFQRRLERDVRERGRTEQGVKDQFLNHVKPMHDLFVQPSSQFADCVFSGEEPAEIYLLEVFRQLNDKNYQVPENVIPLRKP